MNEQSISLEYIHSVFRVGRQMLITKPLEYPLGSMNLFAVHYLVCFTPFLISATCESGFLHSHKVMMN